MVPSASSIHVSGQADVHLATDTKEVSRGRRRGRRADPARRPHRLRKCRGSERTSPSSPRRKSHPSSGRGRHEATPQELRDLVGLPGQHSWLCPRRGAASLPRVGDLPARQLVVPAVAPRLPPLLRAHPPRPSGNPNLTLPYWDWTNPDQRSLPARFLDPRSPLYERNWSFGANSGGELSESAIQWQRALGEIPSPVPAGARFRRPGGSRSGIVPAAWGPGVPGPRPRPRPDRRLHGEPEHGGPGPDLLAAPCQRRPALGRVAAARRTAITPCTPSGSTRLSILWAPGRPGAGHDRPILQLSASDYRYDTEPAGTSPLFAAMAPQKGQQPRNVAMAPQSRRPRSHSLPRPPRSRSWGAGRFRPPSSCAGVEEADWKGSWPPHGQSIDGRRASLRVAVEDIRFDAPPAASTKST